MELSRDIVFNPDKNFLELNPELKYTGIGVRAVEEFGGDLDKAGKFFNALYMLYHPDSKMYNMNLDERLREVGDIYLGGKDYRLGTAFVEDILPTFINYTTSKKKRMFKVWSDKVEELTDRVASLSFSKKKEAEELQDLFKNASHYWKTLDEVEKTMIKEEVEKDPMRGDLKAGKMYQ